MRRHTYTHTHTCKHMEMLRIFYYILSKSLQWLFVFLLFCQYFVKFRGLQLTESLPKICHNLVYFLHFCLFLLLCQFIFSSRVFFYAFLVNFCTVLVCKIFVQFFEMKFSFQNLCFTLVFLCFWFWCFAFFLCRYFAFLSAFFTFYAHAVHDERSHSFSPPFSLSQFTL